MQPSASYMNRIVAPLDHGVGDLYDGNDIQVPPLNDILDIVYGGEPVGGFGQFELELPTLYINPPLVAPVNHSAEVPHYGNDIPEPYYIPNAGMHEGEPMGDVGLFALQHPDRYMDQGLVALVDDVDIPLNNKRANLPQDPTCARKCKGDLMYLSFPKLFT